MRTTRNLLFLALAACLLIPSCSKESQDSDPESGPAEYDGVASFHDFFVKRDSVGTFQYRLYGEPLDKTDTTHLSVGVNDLEEAVNLFCMWCMGDSEEIEAGSSDMMYVPRDLNNQPQGTIFFTAGQSNDGSLAEVTFSQGLKIQDVSKITFVNLNSWPNKGWRSPYKPGDMARRYTAYEKQELNWLCIRSAKPGQPGYLVYISNRTLYPGVQGGADLIGREPALAVSAILRENNNWDSFVTMFKDRLDRNLRSDTAYWIDDSDSGLRLNGIYLKTGFIDWFSMIKLPRHYKPFLMGEPFSIIY